MTDILYYATLALNFSGFLFALVFIWINVFGKYSELAERNASTLHVIRVSMITSIVFSFLTSLLTEGDVTESIDRSAVLYTIIALTWMIVILLCGVTLLLTLLSRKLYKPAVSHAAKRLFKIAIPGAIVCLVLTWLFS